MIELQSLCKAYGGRPVVRDLSLTVPSGSLTVLLGASGCGKSTTLRMINRLIEPDSGTILIEGRDTRAIPPTELRRGIGYVIQGVGLFPHWTVARNIATVPRLLGWPAARIEARVQELLALAGLPPAQFAGKHPSELSGGQAQRVGVARALAADPPVLLMDEPFGALDPITRRDLQRQFRAIQRRTEKSVVFVTHDIDEALLLADQLVLMEAGEIVQAGPPLQLLDQPASETVRDFLGGPNGRLRRLSLIPAAARAEPGAAAGAALARGATLRDALERMLDGGAERIPLEEGGVITLAALLR